ATKLCVGAAARVHRRARREEDRARRGRGRLPRVVADSRDRAEPAVSDAEELMAKHTLPRRTVLRGLGATLALPFLDAMVPVLSKSARAAAAPVHRFQTFYVPNGMAMEYWTPKGEGAAFELSPILEPLAPYRDQTLVLSGIKASWNYI